MNYLRRTSPIWFLAPCLLLGCFTERTPWREAQGFADGAKDNIVDRFYGGGRRIAVQPKSYTYNVYTDSFRIEARITWRGRASNDGSYWSEGVLVVKQRGAAITWRADRMSHNLHRYLSNRELTNGEIGKTVKVTLSDKPY